MMKLTFDEIDPEICKVNGWNTLDIYLKDKLIARAPLSDTDSSGRLEVLLEGVYSGVFTARYSTTNPFPSPKLTIHPLSLGKMVNVEEIKSETLSGSLDDIRKSLTVNGK